MPKPNILHKPSKIRWPSGPIPNWDASESKIEFLQGDFLSATHESINISRTR